MTNNGMRELAHFQDIGEATADNHLLEIPGHIEKIFWDIRPNNGPKTISSTRVAAFKRKLEEYIGVYAPIEAELLSLFNHAYADRNLLKFLLILNRFQPAITASPFVDIGSGIGTAAAAWIATTSPSPEQIAKSICVDRDESQLIEAKEYLLSNLQLPIQPKFTHADFTKLHLSRDSTALLSFSLCEALSESHTNRNIVRILPQNFIIVDYREVISRLFSDAGDMLSGTRIIQETYALKNKLEETLGQRSIKVVGAYAYKQ